MVEPAPLSPERTAARPADLRAFVDQLPAAAALFDAARHCLACSGQFRSAYAGDDGQVDERMIGVRMPEWTTSFDRALAGERVETESCCPDAGGEDQWSSWIFQPWHDEHGGIRGVLVFSQLITRQKQVERDLRLAVSSVEEMNQQLESAIARANGLATEAALADQAKSAFLAMMGHEIRTPLTGVIGMTNILEHTALDDEQRDYLRTIRISGDALLGVINDLLDYSKIEAGYLELESVEFNLRTCVDDALELLAPSASSKGLELAAVFAPEVPRWIRGDVTRLRQILINLIGNAVKFTERGEVIVEVRLAADNDRAARIGSAHRCLELAVRDTGPGIAPDRQHRLFQVYSQLEHSTTRTHGGTGLGLAISRRLAELMGGRMWVESELGRGSTFRFTIVAPAIEKRDPTATPPHLAGRRALVVEDNAVTRQLVIAHATACGVTCEAASDHASALERLKAVGSIDLLVVDDSLPDRSGFALLEQLEPGKRPHWVIGYSRLRGAASAAGVDIVLSKPFRPDTFFRALRQLADGVSHGEARGTAEGLRQTAEREPLRILLAEDNAVNQRVALLMLRRLGYDATAVTDGAQAVVACAEREYDVVLMDVQMPVMDGIEATRRIREQSASQHAPWIIALTAGAFRSDRERALRAGMNDFVTKPLPFEVLQAALARAVEARDAHALVAV